MKNDNEIPSESRQRVVQQLKSINGNVILTCPILGIAEGCLEEYQKQSGNNKVITMMEMQEFQTQIVLENKFLKKYQMEQKNMSLMDYSFYVEVLLALDLCIKLRAEKLRLCDGMTRNRKMMILKFLENQQTELLKKKKSFMLGFSQDYRNDYNQYSYLKSILDVIGDAYDWEWIILDFDRPIENAKEIQQAMYLFMKPEYPCPSRIFISAYDENLRSIQRQSDFHIFHLNYQNSYRVVQQGAYRMLYHSFPRLVEQECIIKSAISSPALQQLYIEANFPIDDFMKGIEKFYNAYSCFYNWKNGCILSEIECFSAIYNYINECLNHKNNFSKVKKSKLYI